VADKDGDRSLNLEDAMSMLAKNIGKMMNPLVGGINMVAMEVIMAMAEEEKVSSAMNVKTLAI